MPFFGIFREIPVQVDQVTNCVEYRKCKMDCGLKVENHGFRMSIAKFKNLRKNIFVVNETPISFFIYSLC